MRWAVGVTVAGDSDGTARAREAKDVLEPRVREDQQLGVHPGKWLEAEPQLMLEGPVFIYAMSEE
jgi:hypothetical protein